MSGYTKGPWVFDYDSIYTTKGTDGHRYPDKQVCRPCDKKTQTYADWTANARLIAAAPDLLEALKELVDFADKAANSTESGAEQVALIELILPVRKAKAAIKRAEAQS